MNGAVKERSEVIVRPATGDDMARILELRKMQEREFIGRVSIPTNLVWIVAEKEGVVRACAGGAFSSADGHERTAIVCEFYDDGTTAGKRGLVAILQDAASADCSLYVIMPLDRPELTRHLIEEFGFAATGIELTRKGLPRAK